MRRQLFYLPCFLTYFTASAQTITVLDQATLEPLVGALVYSGQEERAGMTDGKGHFTINEKWKEDSIFFSYIGYHSLGKSYNNLQESGFKVYMAAREDHADAVVISASRFEEKISDVAQQIEIIGLREIANSSQPTTADLLQQSGNVMVQKSQMGGGSPIIRGFEANKVLIVVDGVRMNNAIYRGGHLQNVITLDNAMLDRVEIVFGPGSVVYGSDALGGVMHFYTKRPMLTDTGEGYLFKTNAFTRYSSAANEATGHVDFNIGLKKLSFFTSLTHSNYGDLRQGSVRNPFYGDFGLRNEYTSRIDGRDTVLPNADPLIQKQSGYAQGSAMQKIYFQPTVYQNHTLNFQYSTSSDVPRYDRLSQYRGGKLRFAEWYYGPQERFLGAYILNLSRKRTLYDHSRITVAYQAIEESRHDRAFGNDMLSHRTERVNVYSFNFDFDKEIDRHELRYGFEAAHNDVISTAFAENITNGEKAKLDTRYPDGGSQMSTLAAYFTHAWEISPKLILSDGVRLSHVRLNARFDDRSLFSFLPEKIEQENTALNGNAGIVFSPGKGWRFTLTGSTGFRAPNVDDLARIFESVPGRVIVPNPNLKPEYTYNLDIGVSKLIRKQLRLEGVGYYTLYKNALTVMPYDLDGQRYLLYGDSMSLIVANVNAGSAYIYGFNFSINADLSDAVTLYSKLSYTYGRINTDSVDYPLDHIPPVFGKSGITLNLKKFRGEFFALYNGWKRLKDYNLAGEDNIANATEFGTPAWYTLNIRTSYQVNTHIRAQVSVENILDLNYRVFASGISAPGRNFIITLRGMF
ncbi:MAG: TonB-dependent receptor [Bacteroidota bacterium]|nr:TonB-dependent receptor [Bacteroidota bacterium]